MRRYRYHLRKPTPSAVNLALDHLRRADVKLTPAVCEVAFELLRRLLFTTKKGSRIRVKSFATPAIASRILKVWEVAGLIVCLDPDAHRPTYLDGEPDFTDCRPRPWLPSADLLLRNIGDRCLDSCFQYRRGKSSPRHTGQGQLWLRPEWRHLTLTDPSTEMFFDWVSFAASRPSAKLVLATSQAVGLTHNIIKPRFVQFPSGRLSARRPAVCGLPRKARRFLLSPDGRPVQYVDFASFEFRIACALAGITCPDDPYTDLVDALSLAVTTDREAVKREVVAILHGRQPGFEHGLPYQEREAARALHDAVRACLPHGLIELVKQWGDDNGFNLQHAGARVFLPAFAACVKDFGLPFGIPLHDGWIFAADTATAEQVRTRFEEVGERVVGVPMPSKLTTLTETEKTHETRPDLARLR